MRTQGPGIRMPCHGPGWDRTIASCLGLSQKTEFSPDQEGRKGRETEESTPVPFPLGFFQGSPLSGPTARNPCPLPCSRALDGPA